MTHTQVNNTQTSISSEHGHQGEELLLVLEAIKLLIALVAMNGLKLQQF